MSISVFYNILSASFNELHHSLATQKQESAQREREGEGEREKANDSGSRGRASF